MKKQPLVSVITPTYNSEKYISETINSVQRQTYKNWEMIIVDDYSKDSTRNILKEFAKKDQRIKLIFLDKNYGAGIARNKAINKSEGKYIAFLDSDDIWKKEKLNIQIEMMEKKDVAFTFASYRMISEDGTLFKKRISVPSKIDYDGLLKNTIIGCLTVVINIEKTGKLKMPNIRTRQPLVLWLELLKKGYIAYGIDKELAYYRVRPNSISRNKIKAAKQVWKVYRKYEKLSIAKASWCFINYAVRAFIKNILNHRIQKN
ncbi:MAG: glycosyltransferase family 2 protein [Bacillota bacterium]